MRADLVEILICQDDRVVLFVNIHDLESLLLRLNRCTPKTQNENAAETPETTSSVLSQLQMHRENEDLLLSLHASRKESESRKQIERRQKRDDRAGDKERGER